MKNSRSKDIDHQSRPFRIIYTKTCQNTINWVWIWPGKLGKWAHGGMKIGALVLFHEVSMNMWFGFMMNNKAQIAISQSGPLGFCKLEQWLKSDFWKWNWPGKVCLQIHHEFKIYTLGEFSVENIGVQSIWLIQSQIWSYNITNRAINQSANNDTSKRWKLRLESSLKTDQTDSWKVKTWNIISLWHLQCNAIGIWTYGSTGSKLEHVKQGFPKFCTECIGMKTVTDQLWGIQNLVKWTRNNSKSET